MDFKISNSYDDSKTKINKTQVILIVLAIFFLILSIVLIVNQNKSIKNKKTTTPTSPVRTIGSDDTNNNDNNDKLYRPIAVMIDNNIGDDLQAGLQDSYLNYEIIVEGGLTRIMSLFNNTDNVLIGPVRSARNYFLDYAKESDAVYAHYGWSPNTPDDIKTLNIDNINGMTSPGPFRRDTKLKAPHNVFTTLEYIKKYMDDNDFRSSSDDWEVLNVNSDSVDLDDFIKEAEYLQMAEKVTINYSYYQNRSYTYDSENKYYLRSMNGKAHKDKSSEQQLHYKNVIIEYVKNNTIDDEGRQSLETTGEGTGYYMTNGYITNIKWKKDNRTSKTIYKYMDGTEVKINDGNTFINIVPIENNIIIE